VDKGKIVLPSHIVGTGVRLRAKPSVISAHDRCRGVAKTLPFFPSGSHKDLVADRSGGPDW
jgi:hypothetical protein